MKKWIRCINWWYVLPRLAAILIMLGVMIWASC